MGVGYRAILSFEASEVSFSDLSAYVVLWLREKNWKVPSEPGVIQGSPGSSLIFSEVQRPVMARRWTLTETWAIENVMEGSQESITSISIIERDERYWVWVEVETPERRWVNSKSGISSVEPAFAGTPRVVHSLIDELRPWDGSTPIFKAASILKSESMGALITVLQDTSRFGSIYVTTPPAGITERDWAKTLDANLRQSRGMGSTFVVASSALRDFNDRVGFGLALSPGSIRTFLPGVDLDEPSDSHRHRSLSYKTLVEKSWTRAGRFLRATQVTRMRSVKIPSFLLEAERSLTRRVRFGSVESPAQLIKNPSKEEAAAYLEIAQLYEREAALHKEESERLKLELDLMRLDNDQLADEVHSLGGNVSHLRSKLIEAGQVSLAFEAADLSRVPDSFEDLLEEAIKLPGLSFAGDRDETLRLDSIQTLSSALTKAWDSLRTLSSYSEMKTSGAFRGSVTDFVKDTSHGGFSGISTIKPESETVRSNPRYRAAREIEVPREVAPNGRVMCQHHISLAKSGGAPTLYFFDATAIDGKVYVGHLGVHLDNTLTN